MESFFDNAQRILDVAASAEANGPDEFAVLLGRDGGMRIVMNQAFQLAAAAADAGADAAYRVVRSESGVRVEGHAWGQDCLLETRVKTPARTQAKTQAKNELKAQWLLDQPMYCVGPALLGSAA